MPTVTIVSELFVPLAQMEATSFGLPHLRLAVVPHPVATYSDAELQEWGRGLVEAIVGGLSQ
jgi:hypothetical protein